MIQLARNGESFLAAITAAQPRALLTEVGLEHQSLQPSEYKTWAGFPSQKRRDDYLVGRCLAKLALSELGGWQLSGIELARGVFGQPVVRAPGCSLDVCLCHSAALATAIAFPAGHPMGLDVECASDVARCDPRRHFDAAETHLAAQANVPAAQWHTVLWTAKEALSKILRCGLTVPFSILLIDSVRRLDEVAVELTFLNFTQYRCVCWTMRDLAISLVLPRKTILPSLSGFWASVVSSLP